MQRILFVGLALVCLTLLFTPKLGAAGDNINPTSQVGSVPPAARDMSAKIDAILLKQLQQGSTSRALIVFNEQADLSGADQFATKEEKGAFVFNALREVADRTQLPTRERLSQQGITHRAFYITNAIEVERLDLDLANQIARESGVGRIVADTEVRMPIPLPTTMRAESAAGIEWGITQIKADKLWANKIRGKGIVVANQDTGVQWDHPALKKQYRGFKQKTGEVDHNYNWWDAVHSSISGGTNPCGYNLSVPCDDYGHGTHTMGTMVGRAGNNYIGVAPKARWIACRNMDSGVGRPSTYLECFEFFLAPWDSAGKNPDPNRAPDVVNNSWGCWLGAPPLGEGCEPNTLKQATNALRQAGIFVTMSAGNYGPGCKTVTDPSGIYNSSTTVGATDRNNMLASFSSRGPVASDDSDRRKPDISAPGVDVRSTVPGNGYGVSSGTSMAAPHVAGAVALLWNAYPNLRSKTNQTEKALFNSAFRKVTISGDPNQVCGGTSRANIPNNLFGWGRLNVFKAYKQLKK